MVPNNAARQDDGIVTDFRPIVLFKLTFKEITAKVDLQLNQFCCVVQSLLACFLLTIVYSVEPRLIIVMCSRVQF